MNTLDRLLTLAEKQIRSVLLEMRQPLLPIWVLVSRNKQVQIRCTPWKNDREKLVAERYIKSLLKMHDTVAYSFISEAWMAPAPKGWDPDTPGGDPIRVINLPEKQEVALAFACDTQEIKWKRWAIIRDWHEQVIDLEEVPTPEGDQQPEGWMTQLLK